MYMTTYTRIIYTERRQKIKIAKQQMQRSVGAYVNLKASLFSSLDVINFFISVISFRASAASATASYRSNVKIERGDPRAKRKRLSFPLFVTSAHFTKYRENLERAVDIDTRDSGIIDRVSTQRSISTRVSNCDYIGCVI